MPVDLFRALDQLGTRQLTGTFYRHTAPRRDALSGEGARMIGGRWNPVGTEALYLAEPREACAAEFRRMAAGQGKGVESFLPRTLHTIAVTDLDIIDLTTPAHLHAVGLSEADLAADDRTACQLVGEAIATSGIGGLLAPSATGIGTVLTVYVRHTRTGQLTLVNSVTVDNDFE